jgi:hypothetical protein
VNSNLCTEKSTHQYVHVDPSVRYIVWVHGTHWNRTNTMHKLQIRIPQIYQLKQSTTPSPIPNTVRTGWLCILGIVSVVQTVVKVVALSTEA